MKQAQAKVKIISAFDAWVKAAGKTNLNGNDAYVFFDYLRCNHSDFLNFRCTGDKWQTVHGWLLSANRVQD